MNICIKVYRQWMLLYRKEALLCYNTNITSSRWGDFQRLIMMLMYKLVFSWMQCNKYTLIQVLLKFLPFVSVIKYQSYLQLIFSSKSTLIIATGINYQHMVLYQNKRWCKIPPMDKHVPNTYYGKQT